MANFYVRNPGGNDGNAGTAALPWLTLQHALDNIVAAGDVIYAQGGETIAATIDIDTILGNVGGIIRVVGTGANWIVDGTRYVITGNGVASDGLNVAEDYYCLENIEITAMQSTGFVVNEGVGQQGVIFHNCYSHDNQGDGFYDAECTGTYFYRCKAEMNDVGFSLGHSYLVFCSASDNGAEGFLGDNGLTCVGCLASGNGSYGFSSAIGLLMHCVADGQIGAGNAGIFASTVSLLVIGCRLTNNITGIISTDLDLLEDYNFLLGNTANFSMGGGSRIELTENTLIAGTEGYIDRVGEDFGLADTATLRRTAVTVGGNP